jgi:hypothetical protein
MDVTSPKISEYDDEDGPGSILQTIFMRLVVWGSAGVAAAAFWWSGKTFGIPHVHGYAGSLFQGSAIANLIAVGILYVSIAAAASIVLGRIRTGIGVFAASFGLAAISVRGGTVSDVLRDLGASATYGMFLGETVVLAAMAAGAMLLSRFLAPLPPLAKLQDDELPKSTDRLLSVGLQTAVTLVLVMVVGQSDTKGQALAAVGAASLVATLIADNCLPVGFTPLAVMAPFAAAIVGYAWALTAAGGSPDPANSLVTALPLDYASFGVAGTMMGHWMTHQWREEAVEDE